MAEKPKKLEKSLKLFDVYAICTGAMFSSGFFLLPGLAAAQTGSSVAIAYLVAGILMLPAMFSMAELATAMPRAGGDYFFLDRAMGPLVGTIGGIGTYLALALKSAFALIGMGAYLALFFEVEDIRPLAVGLTVAFAALNIMGAKETTGLQRFLVTVLVSVMALFIAGGIFSFFGVVETDTTRDAAPFLSDGIGGFLATVGFVFVSYAGLTKIASVSEEVVNPGRNIPLGMMLSIVSTTIIYVVGISLMNGVLGATAFQSSLTPVADAADAMLGFLPGESGLILVVASAVAAFASTGNAGILAASRYPLAMGRDHLLPQRFASLSKQGTPLFAIVVTASLMIFSILVLDESAIAKVASAFQLIIFMLVNLAVIVMRESQIEYYDPVYRTPFYPAMQVGGIIASLFLLSYIGAGALAMTTVVVVASALWYFYYGSKHVQRHGAVFHWFANLGQQRYEGIEHELRQIMKEKGLRTEDPFSEIIARANVIDTPREISFEEATKEALQLFSQDDPLILNDTKPFMNSLEAGVTLIADRAALPNVRLSSATHTEMVIVRSQRGIEVPCDIEGERRMRTVHALFYIISPVEQAGQHLRLLAELSHQVEQTNFLEDWMQADDWHELKEILLHSERLLTLWLTEGHPTSALIGQTVRDVQWPSDTLVAIIRRDGRELIPHGDTTFAANDQLVILGEEDGIEQLYRDYVVAPEAPPPLAAVG